jgi:hypothetical protein
MIYPHAMLRTNTHVHTPYSFCPFDSMDRLVAAAKEEGVAALGINDISTCDGFAEFAKWCDRYGVYPIFNVEFLVRQEDLKGEKSLRNAPADSGFLFLCGKALAHPVHFSADNMNRLTASWKKTQDHLWNLIGRLNDYFASVGIDIALDYNDIRKRHAKKLVHERHVARALYDALVHAYTTPVEFESALIRLFKGEAAAAHRHDPIWVQNEIYTRVLTSNPSVATWTEKQQYMRLREAFSLIIDGGGIPCYSVGAIHVKCAADCERDALKLALTLERNRIHAVDFFPLHAELEILKTYVHVFVSRGFCVTFGTGNNTPERLPLAPTLYGGQPLDEDLMKTGWEGTCLLAGHQEMRKANRTGFVDGQGDLAVSGEARKDVFAIGEQAIRKAAHL